METVKKTVHVLANCYWGDGMSGGDRRLLELVRRWDDIEKYRILVYTPKKFMEFMKAEGVNHPEYIVTDEKVKDSDGIITAYRKRTASCQEKLSKNIKKGDAVYSSTDILPDVVPPYQLKKKLKDDFRWTTISYHIYEAFYKRPGNIVKNFLSCYQQKAAILYGKKLADAYLTTSPLVYEYFEKRKFSKNQIKMVDNAVDIELVEGSDVEAEGYDAVFLARLNYSKGIMELPEIWSKVISKYPEARLGIIGKGSEEIIKELKEKIVSNNVSDNVDILGYLDSEKAYSIIKKSKLFLFTSHEEGWGMALAEALVCGIPVVAYNLPVFSYLFKEGVSLCKLKDTKEMASQVCKYLSDEELRISDGQKGREYIIDHYSLETVAKKELEIILG